MFNRIEIVALLTCAILLISVMEFVRRNRIQVRYSLLWFSTGTSILALTLNRSWLEQIATGLGIHYAPTALFLILSGFMVVIMIHFSIVISQLRRQNMLLAQKLALIETEIDAQVSQRKLNLEPSRESIAA